MVLAAAIPTLPPRFLSRLNSPLALPISFCGRVPKEIPDKDTKIRGSANPLSVTGQNSEVDEMSES